VVCNQASSIKGFLASQSIESVSSEMGREKEQFSAFFPGISALIIAIIIGFFAVPATAAQAVAAQTFASSAAAPAGEDVYRPQGLDDLLNANAASNVREGGVFGAGQAVADAKSTANSTHRSSDEIGLAGVGGNKSHQLKAWVIALVAVAGFLLLSAVALLIWSRIVHYREMRQAAVPMAFNYPRI